MNSEMEKDILKVLVTEEELKTRIAELGEALYKRYEGHRPDGCRSPMISSRTSRAGRLSLWRIFWTPAILWPS